MNTILAWIHLCLDLWTRAKVRRAYKRTDKRTAKRTAAQRQAPMTRIAYRVPSPRYADMVVTVTAMARLVNGSWETEDGWTVPEAHAWEARKVGPNPFHS